ncbi:hypothetical protein GE21DRAFT_1213424, partial [Neurospora crassa]
IEFNFYIEGKVNSIKINRYFQISALIINKLGPNILLGIDFLYYYSVKLDFNTILYSFKSVFSIKV